MFQNQSKSLILQIEKEIDFSIFKSAIWPFLARIFKRLKGYHSVSKSIKKFHFTISKRDRVSDFLNCILPKIQTFESLSQCFKKSHFTTSKRNIISDLFRCILTIFGTNIQTFEMISQCFKITQQVSFYNLAAREP